MPETQARSRHDDILRTIVEAKRAEVKALTPHADELRYRAADAAPPRPFERALAGGERVAVVAEVKRRSPGAGDIRPGLDPAGLARAYEAAGAAALSVLTDGRFFGGSLDDLRAARDAVGLPALRKDFVIDAVQVDEARAGGADAVLLIVRILDDDALAELAGRARELGMACLVEVHDGAELERAVAAGATLIGVNNRDLGTFRTDLAVTEGLLEHLPDGATVVSESGIGSGSDVARLGRSGVHAVLVGEAILRAADPGAKVAELAGHPRSGR